MQKARQDRQVDCGEGNRRHEKAGHRLPGEETRLAAAETSDDSREQHVVRHYHDAGRGRVVPQVVRKLDGRAPDDELADQHPEHGRHEGGRGIQRQDRSSEDDLEEAKLLVRGAVADLHVDELADEGQDHEQGQTELLCLARVLTRPQRVPQRHDEHRGRDPKECREATTRRIET